MRLENETRHYANNWGWNGVGPAAPRQPASAALAPAKCAYVSKAYQIKAISQYAAPGAREREEAAQLVASFDTLGEARNYLRDHAEGAERQGLCLFLSYPAALYEYTLTGYDWRGDVVEPPCVNEHGEVLED